MDVRETLLSLQVLTTPSLLPHSLTRSLALDLFCCSSLDSWLPRHSSSQSLTHSRTHTYNCRAGVALSACPPPVESSPSDDRDSDSEQGAPPPLPLPGSLLDSLPDFPALGLGTRSPCLVARALLREGSSCTREGGED
jgi:hypothetical protein